MLPFNPAHFIPPYIHNHFVGPLLSLIPILLIQVAILISAYENNEIFCFDRPVLSRMGFLIVLQYLLEIYSLFGIEMRLVMLLGLGVLVMTASGEFLAIDKRWDERKREATEFEDLREQVRMLENELRMLRGEGIVKKERTSTQLRIVGGSGNEW